MKFMTNKLSKLMLSSLVLVSLGMTGVSANAAHTHTSSHVKTTKVQKANEKQTKDTKAIKVFPQKVSKAKTNINGSDKEQDKNFSKVKKVAKSKLGDRYEWGAVGPHRFDCAGFTQYVYKHASHIKLPRTAGAQKEYCHKVSEKHVKAGDLVFFGHGRNVEHVGLCLGHGKMIDAQLRGVITEHIHAPWWHLDGYGRIPATK